jgi:P-aminobenzoate N-oxygenase AurF
MHYSPKMQFPAPFTRLLKSLCDISIARAYDPYTIFDWPASIPNTGLWMSADLLSVHGTSKQHELRPGQLTVLSRWELINFFSFNVNGIRELMHGVLTQIHRAGLENASEYFHHFLNEENKHMWFFAQFCRRYGGKIYSRKNMQYPAFDEPDAQCFLLFARILISEQVSDYYNTRMMGDESLPAIVRQVNRVHHQDESRHIAMGLQLVRHLHEHIVANHPPELWGRMQRYLHRYMQFFVQSFYNQNVYRDAGLHDPHQWRASLIDHPARISFHSQVLARTERFFRRHGILN